MNKVLSSIVAVAVAGATFGAFAQPAKKSETTVEKSTVTTPAGEVKDEKKTTTTTTVKPEAKAAAKSSTSTTTTERKGDGSKVKTETKVETEKKY